VLIDRLEAGAGHVRPKLDLIWKPESRIDTRLCGVFASVVLYSLLLACPLIEDWPSSCVLGYRGALIPPNLLQTSSAVKYLEGKGYHM
jgi:hypothetical protein